MATSLVSTGVQFPDSSIQTTAAGASGLTFISSQTISSTVASMDFTSGISSTYDSYFVVFSNFQIQNGGRIALRLRQGSTFVTSGYATYFFSVQNGNVFNANFDTNATFLMSNQSGTPDNAGYSSGYFTLLSANIATARVAAVNGYSSTAGNNGSSSTIQNFSGGLTSTGVITGFQFLSQSGNLNGGTATLYGMAKA